MKKAILTVLIGDYESLKPAPEYAGWDSILITDQNLTDYQGWKLIQVPTSKNPKLDSRRYKILSHIYLPEYDLVCYIDASVTLLKEPPSKPIRFNHPSRKSFDEESYAVVRYGKDNNRNVYEQKKFYRREKFRDKEGLFQNGFFVRENNEETNKLHEFWFDQVEKFSYRDQLSLPYCLWKLGVKLPICQDKITDWIYVGKHTKQTLSVHHIIGGRSDKNIGLSLNMLIEHLPEGDWICLRDSDTVPMDHVKLYQQCEQIAETGKFQLVGGITNRLGLDYQLHDGKISDNFDIKHHRKIGLELSAKYGSEVVSSSGQKIGGFFMLFSKAIWRKAGKFKEGSIRSKGGLFDAVFSKEVMRVGGKIGIAKGIYIFHLYRIDSDNPMKSTEHLE